LTTHENTGVARFHTASANTRPSRPPASSPVNAESMAIDADLNIAEISRDSGTPDADMRSWQRVPPLTM
jgi:hypothetical protein